MFHNYKALSSYSFWERPLMQCAFCRRSATLRCESKCGFATCHICGKSKSHSHESESSVNRRLFDEFWQENHGSKLVVPETYPINRVELDRWAEEMQRAPGPPELGQFAQCFAQRLHHVSFERFRLRLRVVADEIVADIEQNPKEKVYLLIDGDIRKSNTWIALLCWRILRPVVTDIVRDLSQIPNQEWDDISIIHLDDMSYSGNQMANAISRGLIFLSEDTRYYMLIPYIGVAAKTLLTDLTDHLIFLPSTRVVKTIRMYLEQDGYNSDAILKVLGTQPWLRFYGVREWHVPIYFDFKLADALSIPNKMLAALYVFDENQKVKFTFHPITGCEDTLYKTKTNDDLSPTVMAPDFLDEHTCPPAYYKRILYTFHGEKVEKSSRNILEILNAMSKPKK